MAGQISKDDLRLVEKMVLNANVTLEGTSDNRLRVTNTSGNIEIGPQNSSVCHIYTDMPRFYFNKEIQINADFVIRQNGTIDLTSGYLPVAVGDYTVGPTTVAYSANDLTVNGQFNIVRTGTDVSDLIAQQITASGNFSGELTTYGLYIDHSRISSGNNSINYGIYNKVTGYSSSSNSSYGTYNDVVSRGGYSGNVYGTYNNISHTTASYPNTSTNFYGSRSLITINDSTLGAGTIPTIYGIRSGTVLGDDRTLTTHYALFLDTTSIGTSSSITNNYAIYQQDGAATNYFAANTRVLGGVDTNTIDEYTTDAGVTIESVHIENGKVGIGTVAPTSTSELTIRGGANPIKYERATNTAGWGVGPLFYMQNSTSGWQTYAALNGTIVDNTAGAEYGRFNFYLTDSGTLTLKATMNSTSFNISDVHTNIITEYTAESGVTVEEVLIKDGGIDWSFITGVDTFVETVTGGTGISSTGTTAITVALTVDELSEKTGDLVATDRLVGTSGTTNFAETISNIPLIEFATSGIELTDNKSASNGYASLDASAKVPLSELPDTVLGAMQYKGTWNASTNTPDIDGTSPEQGDYWVVSVAGSTNLDGITDWEIGDWAIYNGTTWDKIDNSDKVSSVDGKTGAVDLTGDYDKYTSWDLLVNGASLNAITFGENVDFIDGGGIDITVASATVANVTIAHADTSAQGSINGSGRTYIQDITLDTYGHVTGLATATETVVNVDTWRPVTAGGNSLGAAETLAFTQGTNVTITEAAGAVTINSTDQYVGTVTSVGGINGVESTGGTTPDIGLIYSGVQNFVDITHNLEGTSIADTETIIYAGADNNIHKGLVSDLPFSNNDGTVTTVTAGNGLTGGGSPTPTLTVGEGSGLTVSGEAVGVQYLGIVNYIDVGTNLEGTEIGTGDTIAYHDATDNNVKKGFVSNLPFSNNAGTVTSVGGTGTVSGITLTGTVTDSGNLTLGGAITGFDNYNGWDLLVNGLSTNRIISGENVDFIDGGGIDITVASATVANVTIAHANTSSQGSINGSSRTYIQDVTLDTYGHVTGLATATETVVNANETITLSGDVGGTGTTAITTTIGADKVTYAKMQNVSVDDRILGNVAGIGGAVAELDAATVRTMINVADGATANDGTVTTVTAGDGLTGGGSPTPTLTVGQGGGINVNATNVEVDYGGANNVVLAATDGTAIGTLVTTDKVMISDATDSNAKYVNVSQFPFSNNAGTVTSVSGTGTVSGITLTGTVTDSGNLTLGGAITGFDNYGSWTIKDGDTTTYTIISGDTLQIASGAGITSNFTADDVLTISHIAHTGDVTGSTALTIGADKVTYAKMQNVVSDDRILGNVAGAGGIVTELDAGTVRTMINVANGAATGTVTSVGVGTGLDVTGGTLDAVITLDLNELAAGGTLLATDYLVSVNGGLTQQQIISSIPLGIFNNDQGWSSTVGTVTSVSGGFGLAGSVTSSGVISAQYGGVQDNIINAATDGTALGTMVTTDKILLADTSDLDEVYYINVSQLPFSNNAGTVTTVTAGNGLSGGGSPTPTLTVGAGSGISVGTTTVGVDYLGTNNFIDVATNLEGTPIDAGDSIAYHDNTDNNVKKGFVSNLPFSNNSGTVDTSGTPVNNQLAVFTDANTIEGDSDVTWDNATFTVVGDTTAGDIAGRKITLGSSAFADQASITGATYYRVYGTFLSGTHQAYDVGGPANGFRQFWGKTYYVHEESTTITEDPKVIFRIGTTDVGYIGIDNGDGDLFKMGYGSTVGSSVWFTGDSSANVGLGGGTNASYKVYVTGAIGATGVINTNSSYRIDGVDIIDVNGHQTGVLNTRQLLHFGRDTQLSAGPYSSATADATTIDGATNTVGYRMIRSGKVTGISVQYNVTANTGGATFRATVQDGGSNTTMYAQGTVASTGNQGASSTANSFDVSANDLVNVELRIDANGGGGSVTADNIAILVEISA